MRGKYGEKSVLHKNEFRISSDKKVLLMHPFLHYHGGGENMLSVVANEVYPDADIFVFSYNPKIVKELNIDEKRLISPLGKGLLGKFYRQSTPLYPALIDTLNYESYDIVISLSYCYLHGLVTSAQQLHVSYIHTPMRLLWLKEYEHYWYNKVHGIREVYHQILTWQRLWDRQAAMRPDYLLANSGTVKDRISAFWNRDSEILYPPVNTAFFTTKSENIQKEEFYITHSRMVRYKRIDLLVEGMKRLHKKLVVVGDGPDYKRLKKIAGDSADIQFTGFISDEEKKSLLHKAQGFLFACDEDFGIATVEAMAAGLPVYAYGAGGVLESTTPEVATYFKRQTVDSFVDTFPVFEKEITKIAREIPIKQAEKFSKERFIAAFGQKIAEYGADFAEHGPPTIN